MATKTVSATNYRAHRATRASATGTFANNSFPSNTPGFLPVGWNETTTYKCRFGMFFNIDFSDVYSITSATLTATYYEPTPNDQVNQTCTASREVWFNRATANYDTAVWNLSTSIHSASTPAHGTASLTSTTAGGDTITVDVTALVQYWFANAGTNLGCYVRMGTDTSGTYAPATTTPASNMPAASFNEDFSLDITYKPIPSSPSAPTLVSGATTDGVTVGSTTAIKTFDATTTTTCNLRFSFNDADEGAANWNDYCYAYSIEIFTNSAFTGSPVWSESKTTTGSPTGTITYALDFNNVPKDQDLYWRVKTIDTNPGTTYSSYSSLTNGSGTSQKIAKFRVQAAIVTPPPPGGGGGNPTYTSTTTFARNKFRVEFYQIQDTITSGLALSNADSNPQTPAPSFNPTPNKHADGSWKASAIIHDAKKVGISHTVNDAGEFFMTIPSNHPQATQIVPLRTFWRACRWDEKNSYFIVIGEGMVTETSSSPNEIIVYGTDKLGMLKRLVVPVDKTLLGAYYTFQNFRLDQIHDSLLPSAGNTETSLSRTVTTRVVAADANKGSLVTLTTSAAHGFSAGDPVTVANVNDSELNGTFVVNTVPTTTTFTYRISNKSKTLASGSAGATATAVVNKYTRHMFEPFQASRNIYAGTTDVSANPAASTYRTVTETRSIMCDGKDYLTTLSEFADILMAGTTDTVIIENPNIGLPADNPKNLNQGIQYRHLKEADVPSPKFWLKYGDSVSNFRYDPLTSRIASRASIINYAYDTSTATTTTSLFGVKSALNFPIYDNYGLIETFERIDDERNDLQFAANLLYNRYPNQVLEFNLDVVSSQITPFGGYKVGDLMQVYIQRRNVSVSDKFALTRQEWMGNEDGSENIAFYFSPQQRASFKVAS